MKVAVRNFFSLKAQWESSRFLSKEGLEILQDFYLSLLSVSVHEDQLIHLTWKMVRPCIMFCGLKIPSDRLSHSNLLFYRSLKRLSQLFGHKLPTAFCMFTSLLLSEIKWFQFLFINNGEVTHTFIFWRRISSL